jgi:hypothetical protein
LQIQIFAEDQGLAASLPEATDWPDFELESVSSEQEPPEYTVDSTMTPPVSMMTTPDSENPIENATHIDTIETGLQPDAGAGATATEPAEHNESFNSALQQDVSPNLVDKTIPPVNSNANNETQQASDKVVRGYRLVLKLLDGNAGSLFQEIGIGGDNNEWEIALTPGMLSALKNMQTDAESIDQKNEELLQFMIGAGTFTSISLSAGFIAWLLRTGTLAATLFTTAPLWRSFDPIPVLTHNKDGKGNVRDS